MAEVERSRKFVNEKSMLNNLSWRDWDWLWFWRIKKERKMRMEGGRKKKKRFRFIGESCRFGFFFPLRVGPESDVWGSYWFGTYVKIKGRTLTNIQELWNSETRFEVLRLCNGRPRGQDNKKGERDFLPMYVHNQWKFSGSNKRGYLERTNWNSVELVISGLRISCCETIRIGWQIWKKGDEYRTQGAQVLKFKAGGTVRETQISRTQERRKGRTRLEWRERERTTSSQEVFSVSRWTLHNWVNTVESLNLGKLPWTFQSDWVIFVVRDQNFRHFRQPNLSNSYLTFYSKIFISSRTLV